MIELLLVAAMAMPVHDTQILNCSKNIVQAKKLDERLLSNGLLAESYDVTGDGKKDVVALSITTGPTPANGEGDVPHQPFPIFYILDTNGDGEADTVLVDKDGKGFCESIVLYQRLDGPITPNSQPMVPHGGRTNL